MELGKRALALVTLSAGVLLVNGTSPRGVARGQMADRSSTADARETTQTKITRAMSAGPAGIVQSARIIDTDAHRRMLVLREGNNGFTCMPGNPRVGDPLMCADAPAMQWSADFKAHKANPQALCQTSSPAAHKPTGAYIMWAGSPYAHLHTVGRP